MASQTEELHAMIAALAGSQALLLDALRRRGSIDEEDIDYILSVTEQGIAKDGWYCRAQSRGPNDQAVLAATFDF
jgi:hypothetical protein